MYQTLMYLQPSHMRPRCLLAIARVHPRGFPRLKAVPLITPTLHKPHTDTDASTTEDGAEARMRQALGKLGTARPGQPVAPRRTTYQARPGAGRHRFRQDGEVPVVRISLAEGSRGEERQPRAPVEAMQGGAGQGYRGDTRIQDSGDSARQVQILTEQLQAVRTRLGHAELVAGEASRTAQARQEEAAALRRSLDTAEATLAQVRAQLVASEQVREELKRHRDATWHSGREAGERDGTATRRRVGRPLGSVRRVGNQVPASEPAPVKWWTGD